MSIDKKDERDDGSVLNAVEWAGLVWLIILAIEFFVLILVMLGVIR